MPDGFFNSDGLITAETALQRNLAAFNRERFDPALPMVDWRSGIDRMAEGLREEGAFLEERRAAVSARAAEAPRDADKFVRWFEALEKDGPGQHDPLFPWLAKTATMEQMRWFLTQEIAGEAGFEDLSALTQVKLPVRPKLEIARNYWDEMGRGNPKGMHGPLLEALAEHLGLEPRVETTVWEALALANVMAGLAANRRYAYHSVGALGVIEQTAPARAALVGKGLKRLGVLSGDRHYFDLHAILDVKHSAAWNSEAIHPLVASNPVLAPAIAEGALMRLECGAACFQRYRQEFEI
ncbi:iron-containing redox enzyme family protein [Dankookia rubra]|uniref:Iron-containing redox enzyme family protein n=1 Tax=Dankookia rubra TaxID=1442381 RepID=A0A4R5Q6J3_9PROT|nr:iron-containing redox enzyme family protein [Dankookia rubra]TDH58058.1 iron-containing redox enzyme family protein [Dankookia rubra]